MNIKYGKKVFIRNTGKDEYWLKDIILQNPSIISLGELHFLNKEEIQVSGGRLDILLKDPEDNNTMYEVEVMLGETDPSHIIRTIEYWDNERRKYPQRQHFAVLVAESFDRRYFNVVQILSLNIPLIAIQVDLLETGKDEYVLNFAKILDVYVEPEDTEEPKIVNESSWNDKSPWTLKTAKELLNIIESSKKSLNYTQSYISIVMDNLNSYMLNKRTKPTSIMWFRVKDDEKVDKIKIILDKYGISYNYNNRSRDFSMNIDEDFVRDNKDLLVDINNIRFKELSFEE